MQPDSDLSKMLEPRRPLAFQDERDRTASAIADASKLLAETAAQLRYVLNYRNPACGLNSGFNFGLGFWIAAVFVGVAVAVAIPLLVAAGFFTTWYHQR